MNKKATFSDVECVFNSVELKFSSAEHRFNTIEHRLSLRIRTNAINDEDNHH